MALAKAAMGGRLGMKISLAAIPASEKCGDLEKLFSESAGRFLATVAPDKAEAFEKTLSGGTFAKIGVVTEKNELEFSGTEAGVIRVGLDELLRNYKETLDQV